MVIHLIFAHLSLLPGGPPLPSPPPPFPPPSGREAAATHSSGFLAGFLSSLFLSTALLLLSVLFFFASARSRQLATAAWLPMRPSDTARYEPQDERLLMQQTGHEAVESGKASPQAGAEVH